MKITTFRIVTSMLCVCTFASGEDSIVSIPKTTEPLMIESKKRLTQEWLAKETYTVEQLDGYQEESDPNYSKFGGIEGTDFPATGFFYTTKHNDRWWLVDPEGNLFIHKAICAVSPGSSDNFKKNFEEKFGSNDVWVEYVTQQLRDLGFSGTAMWSKNDMLREAEHRPVYTQSWSFMSSYGKQRGKAVMGTGHHKYEGGVMPVFDPEFEIFADEYAKRLAANKDDPYLLGHFSDNELPFRIESLDLCLKLDHDDPGYKASIDWLRQRKSSEDVGLNDINDEDRKAFLAYYLERYLSVVSSAIKKHDPNHLYLGMRLIRVSGIEEVISTYGKYADVMSMNWYGNWMLPRERITSWAEWADTPFIISEWYAKGHDVPGLSNESGAGWLVKTQKERGYYYQNMALNLLASPNAVGWHWFKYADNDPANLKTDPSNRNSNKGIVNVRYEPYTDLTEAMKQVNTQAYRIVEFFDEYPYANTQYNE